MGEEELKEEAMRMLFSARWNLPKAALHMGVSREECKEMFNRYCADHPIVPLEDNNPD